MYWFHLFGKYEDHLHYTNYFKKLDVRAVGLEYSKVAIKKRILAVINYDNEQYEKFREEVKYCRDKFLAHREIDAKGIYPNINICRLMAEELRVILSEIVEKCNEKSPDNNELFWMHQYYLSHNNKWLYNKCLILYNARLEDSSDAKL